jgi:hypothetical protein
MESRWLGNLHVRFGERGAETTCREAGRRCAPTLLSVCSGRDHRDLDECRQDRGRSDRTFRPQRRGGRPEAAFLSREECEPVRRGRKSRTGVAGERSRRSRSSIRHATSRTCWPQPKLTRPEGSRLADHHRDYSDWQNGNNVSEAVGVHHSVCLSWMRDRIFAPPPCSWAKCLSRSIAGEMPAGKSCGQALSLRKTSPASASLPYALIWLASAATAAASLSLPNRGLSASARRKAGLRVRPDIALVANGTCNTCPPSLRKEAARLGPRCRACNARLDKSIVTGIGGDGRRLAPCHRHRARPAGTGGGLT